jgi:DNA polymerase III epsilon subunit-like protein
MILVVVDVEADGPCPGLHSMVCFGAVVVEPSLERTFYGRTRPISDRFDPKALAISGFTREEHRTFEEPRETMARFARWVDTLEEPVFASDNLAFDWQWINHYFWHFVGRNPFGWSGRRIGDLYAGFKQDLRHPWKHHRKTAHDHHPVNDAKGNAEALLHLAAQGVRGILPKGAPS